MDGFAEHVLRLPIQLVALQEQHLPPRDVLLWQDRVALKDAWRMALIAHVLADVKQEFHGAVSPTRNGQM